MSAEQAASSLEEIKWVVVTGASRGVGKAIAKALWAAGFGVVLWARDENRLRMAAEAISPEGIRLRWAVADVGDHVQIDRAVAATIPTGKRLAGIVLNAGHGRWRSIADLDCQEWQNTIDSNLTGAFITLKALLHRLDYSNYPIVMGILSDSALSTFPDRAAYACAKSGFAVLLSTFRREFRTQGVRVCHLYPSQIDTHFAGSHNVAQPGMRPNGLDPSEVAAAAQWVFQAPPTVEIRELRMSSLKAQFGLEEECIANVP